MDEEFSTRRMRESMCDVGEFIRPDTIADQLGNDGYTRLNRPTRPDGSPGGVPIPYPPAGNAGMDSDGDADDYRWAPYQQSDATTSSAGPP
jgi:hypothetical protein